MPLVSIDQNASLGQLAVDPPFQGRGIARQLVDLAERRALDWDAQRVVIDTSEHASELLATYARRGYEVVDSHQGDVTNHRSVVLAKQLRR